MINVDLVLHERDRIHLQKNLLRLKSNPYTHYESFEKEVDELIKSGAIPDELVRLCEARKLVDMFANPYVLINNCPIDPHLPS